jgi:hypothetical protein
MILTDLGIPIYGWKARKAADWAGKSERGSIPTD